MNQNLNNLWFIPTDGHKGYLILPDCLLITPEKQTNNTVHALNEAQLEGCSWYIEPVSKEAGSSVQLSEIPFKPFKCCKIKTRL